MRAIHVAALVAALLFLLSAGGRENSDGRIVIRNRTGQAITSVTIDPCGASTPGPNGLEEGDLPAGQSASFDVRFGCHEVVLLRAFLPPLDASTAPVYSLG